MNLTDALRQIAGYLSLDADALIADAAEDSYGGWHPDEAQRAFPVGSLFGVEGQVLYALVRAVRPNRVLELGVNHGASATHLLAAAQANGAGTVTSVDVWEGAGQLIPDALKQDADLVYGDALLAISDLPDNSIGFVFEDLLHGAEQVRDVIDALRPKLTSGALVVHHDSEHGDDGVKVKQGLVLAGVADSLSLLIEPSDCGLLFWRAPVRETPVVKEAPKAHVKKASPRRKAKA